MPASELPRPTTYQFITWRICVYSASGLRSTSAFRMYVSVNFVCLQRKCGCLRRMASCLSELGMRLSQNNSFLCQAHSTSLRGLSACFRKYSLLPQREPAMIKPNKTLVCPVIVLRKTCPASRWLDIVSPQTLPKLLEAPSSSMELP